MAHEDLQSIIDGMADVSPLDAALESDDVFAIGESLGEQVSCEQLLGAIDESIDLRD